MKNTVIGLFALLVFAVVACKKESADPCGEVVAFSAPDSISLCVNQLAKSSGSDGAQIQFLGIVADSRCPDGAECIIAGWAEAKLRLVQGGDTSDIVLATDFSPTDMKHTATLGSLSIELRDVSPYPKVGESIALEDYKVHLLMK